SMSVASGPAAIDGPGVTATIGGAACPSLPLAPPPILIGRLDVLTARPAAPDGLLLLQTAPIQTAPREDARTFTAILLLQINRNKDDPQIAPGHPHFRSIMGDFVIFS
ncbi:MAG: hypothetical protein E6501_22705, partial [Bradyrhizobium sp.]|nr:hypothetical protein [Bradyrhizobium sp.]